MAYPKVRQFRTGWSFSRLDQYEGCPAQAAYKHLDKLPEPSSPALARGADIHQKAEHYLKGLIRSIPPELKSLETEMKGLKARFKARATNLPIFVEEMWGFTAAWEPCRSDDWNNCRIRIKMDAGYFLTDTHGQIDDFKTGKLRPEMSAKYNDQLDLYNVGMLSKFPQLERASARLLYLDLGLIYPAVGEEQVLLRKDLAKAQKRWDKRAAKLLNDTKFKPTPGNACRWCAFGQSKGGPCFYG